ncbi:hypothetical protein [Metapseudomonas furukawaii]|uniref:Uncharacterized protein n=1 Tax=Metapseudomonas furukawaii TaxID=1149133 RepID=L8MR69_METFU|nr:hypothetical protein [Pseudomonas furukawaii]ELS25826.1 hypothetical protein ppKF707_6055 [Pseudomonas furukawaii]ELS29304.1 hypothetical protein ppKF707_0129 [Pseudomonas furukawaii]BAU76100.1 hypothetical protein KF707C_44120 [Pseudomonas furukawaii]BAU76491.1 hypothetical protein KF707C_48030 [Pseudomonas furukawaii]
MTSFALNLNATQAMGLIGQTVMMELVWEQDPEPLWRCFHIVGVVVPLEGLVEEGHFLVLNALHEERFPNEVFWSNIRTLTTLHRRPLSGSDQPSPVFGGLIRSGAALPARRNRISVPANGSTGAAHP